MKRNKVIELGEAIELQRGYDLTSAQMEPGTIPVAGSNGVIGYHNISKTSAPAITIGRSGTIGKVHFYIEPIWPHNTSLFITNYKNNNPRYIYYLLQQVDFKKVCDSSVIPSLNRNFVYPIKVQFVPDLDEQRKIAAVLTALDDKIALNRRINDKLEAMAKRLYDYWFVQFDFPDENGRPYKSSGGKMVWNETLKREIPKGWEVKRLGEVCSFRNGINYDKSVLGNKKYKIINVRNMTASSLFLNQNDFDEICLPSYLADGYIIHDNTVLIARSGSPGATRIINSVEADVIFCGFIICMENFDKRYKMYFAYNLKSLENTNATKTGGSILQNVSQDTLKRIIMVIPPAEIINSFNRYISTNIKECDLITKQSDELNSIRDRLLPLLMNGQVEVM